MAAAASVSGAICLKPSSKGSRRAREATSFARRSVAATRAPLAKASVIRSDAGAGRGQHCPPLRAVVDAAPIATKKVSLLELLQTDEFFARQPIGESI